MHLFKWNYTNAVNDLQTCKHNYALTQNHASTNEIPWGNWKFSGSGN